MKPGDIIYPDNYQGDRLEVDQDQSQPESNVSNDQPIESATEPPAEPAAVPIPVPKPESELAPTPNQPVTLTSPPPPIQRSAQPIAGVPDSSEKPVVQRTSQSKLKLLNLIEMLKPKQKPAPVAQDIKTEPSKPQTTESVEIPQWTWLVIIVLVVIILAGVYYLIQAK